MLKFTSLILVQFIIFTGVIVLSILLMDFVFSLCPSGNHTKYSMPFVMTNFDCCFMFNTSYDGGWGGGALGHALYHWRVHPILMPGLLPPT